MFLLLLLVVVVVTVVCLLNLSTLYKTNNHN